MMEFKSPDLIKQFEGLSLTAYKCPADVWTIGYGSTHGLTDTLKENDTITLEEAEVLLQSDLDPFCAGINRLVEVPLTQNQFDALVSLAYNIGLGNFGSSTLRRLLNGGKYNLAADQFLVWRKAGGKILKGLERRRAIERDLFLS